jgi:RNA polymerase sigma factor (sigma-70 family)
VLLPDPFLCFMSYALLTFSMGNNESNIAKECPVWRNFRNGDVMALARIFNENYDSLYYYGKKLVPDDGDLVKDCVQNLFLKIWISHANLMAVKYVRPYLLKALRRLIGDQVMALTRHKTLTQQFLNEFQITFSHEDFLIATQVSREQSEALARSMNKLSCRQREAIFLKFYEGLDYVKIAEVMMMNVQSVRNLIHQSLRTIKHQMTAGTAVFINS